MENAQNIEDWGLHQVFMANTRPPYWSTVQLRDDDDENQTDFEKDTDMSVLYEKEDPKNPQPETVVNVNQRVPLGTHLLQLRDDDPSKMEGMLMEDPNIPLNMRLVHIKTEEGDELIRIQ